MTDDPQQHLARLELDAGAGVSAADEGEVVALWSYDDYGDSPAALNADQARQLRDWLTTWLDRQ